MPLPVPFTGESHDDFLERCVEFVLEHGEAEDQEQAVAICATQWSVGGERMGKQVKVIKFEVVEQREDGGRIRISTAAFDRDNDRVLSRGARVDNYMKNPVVQWGHNYFEPWATTGRTNALEIGDGYIDADFTLRPAANDSDPQNIIRLLWAGGWINAASIGFQPDPEKMVANDAGGWDFEEWELLEWSLVPVPANQEALRLAVKGMVSAVPEARQPMREATYQACGQQYQASETLAAYYLAGLAPALCESCSAAQEAKRVDVEQKNTLTRSGRAWVRRMKALSNDGRRQDLFAVFCEYQVEVDEDATTLEVVGGNLLQVPHPNAGETVHGKEVHFVPPLAYYSDKWGDDALYSAGGPALPDEELVAPWDDEYEVLEISEVLLEIEVENGKSARPAARVTKSLLALLEKKDDAGEEADVEAEVEEDSTGDPPDVAAPDDHEETEGDPDPGPGDAADTGDDEELPPELEEALAETLGSVLEIVSEITEEE
jgi:hypothetical protein